MKLTLHPDCRIITQHPCGLVAIDKAAGVLSHPNRPADAPGALLDLPYDANDETYRDGNACWYLLNRLDGPTSGVLLLSSDADIAQRVKQLFADHQVSKTYYALVKGIARHPREHWRDYIKTARNAGVLRSAIAVGPANAYTDVEKIQAGDGTPARTLLRLQPHSGKTHQLRVQCAHRHLPIIGDATYGDFSFNRSVWKRTGNKRLYLHCAATTLKFRHADRVIEVHAESPLPDAFNQLLRQGAV